MTGARRNQPVVDVFTDGACSGNPGPGGWGVLMRWNQHERELMGGESMTTNNRMEMTAAIGALEALKQPSIVRLHTDSTYLRDGIRQWLPRWKARGWRTADRKPVKNQDLWEALERSAAKHRLTWHWVPGHAGVPGNERVDRLANAAIDSLER